MMEAYNAECDRILAMLINEKEKITPIELIAILFYSGKNMYEQKVKTEWSLFIPYLKPLIDYLLTHFDLIDKAKLEEHIRSEFADKSDMSIQSYLHTVEMFAKNLYKAKMHEYQVANDHDLRCNSVDPNDPSRVDENVKKYYDMYFKLYVSKIFYFLVCYSFKEEITTRLMELYPQMTRNEMIDLFESTHASNSAASFEKTFSMKVGSESILKSLMNDHIHTPYFFMNQLETQEKTFMDKVEVASQSFENDPVFMTLMMSISNVESDICSGVDVEMEHENKEDLHRVFDAVVRREIVKNRLNPTPLAEKLFYDYFMTLKAMKSLEYTMESATKTLETCIDAFSTKKSENKSM